MVEEPEKFRLAVQKSLVRQIDAINSLAERGMYFLITAMPFSLKSRAGAAVLNADGKFKYPSYVQDIMGPLCFDHGFGPFRWVCTSGKEEDLMMTDTIAMQVLEDIRKNAPTEIQGQLQDNIHWIREAQKNKLVVGSQARILYADAEGRIKIASAFNQAIKEKRISAPLFSVATHQTCPNGLALQRNV